MNAMEKREDIFIQRYFAPLAGLGAFGLKDDAASISVPAGYDLIISTDTLLSNVHFFPEDPPGLLSRKALRVSLSDLAAKGAEPTGYFLSLGLPSRLFGNEDWLKDFADGLAVDQALFGLSLLGGDTVTTDRSGGGLTITILAQGLVPTGQMVRREGAKPGDLVLVSGTIGDAALGLHVRKERLNGVETPLISGLSDELMSELEQAYLLPKPNLSAASALRTYASAAMDISDGLLGDAKSLAGVSRISLSLQAAKVPHLVDATAPARRSCLLTGGDDYQILCTLPPIGLEPFLQEASGQWTVIGSVDEGMGVTLTDGSELGLESIGGSFDHLAG